MNKFVWPILVLTCALVPSARGSAAESGKEAVVPMVKLVADLASKLKKEGYEIEQMGSFLVGKKPDERCYYRTLPDKKMTPETFASRSYAGTTWTRTEFQPDFFPIGPYIYGLSSWQEARGKVLGMSLEEFLEHLAKDVKAHGGNTIYYANLTEESEAFKKAVTAAQKHGVRVFAQLTGSLYLRPAKGREYYETVTLPAAKEILPQYCGLKGVAAWMPFEELPPDEMDMLAEYRGRIRELDQTHAIFTVHNNISTFRLEHNNLPEWFGFDRYRFKCLHGKYGILVSTPKDMAQSLRSDIHNFYVEAAKRGRPLIFVMQGFGTQNMFTSEDVKHWSRGAKDSLDPWSGFKQVEPGKWLGWDRYPPPEHGMYLQSWLAVMEGAKGLFIHFYGPGGPGRTGTLKYFTLVDQRGKETRLWREFAECMKEMKPLLPLFMSWHKEALVRARADDPNIAVRSFIRRFDAERYLVVLNQRIATWDKSSPGLPRGKTELHFDEQGLAGLHAVGPLTFRLEVAGKEPIWDIISGKQIVGESDGAYKLTVRPGRAVVLMQGPGKELRNLRKELGLGW